MPRSLEGLHAVLTRTVGQNLALWVIRSITRSMPRGSNASVPIHTPQAILPIHTPDVCIGGYPNGP